jgi:hypothetical protein
MKALRQQQQEFLAYLRGQEGRESPALVESHALGSIGLSIYVHAYRARLREALENDHAGLGRYLGDDLWERLSNGYIDAYPSRRRSLRHFGDALPEYLRHTAPFSTRPVVAELALFERALLDSFDAADARTSTWHEVAATPAHEWPSLRLRFHPSLHRLTFDWNAVEIWQSLKDGSVPPPSRPAEAAGWALWRDHERVTRFRSMANEEVAALDLFAAGGDFSQFCTWLAALHEATQVPARALEYLRLWTNAGWIAQ